MNIRNLIISKLLVLSLALAGCTSIRSVPIQKDDPGSKFKKGEQISVSLKNGEVHQILFSRAIATQIRGVSVNPPYDQVMFNYADIADIKAERTNTPKTIGAIVGGIVLIPFLAVFYAGDFLCKNGGCN